MSETNLFEQVAAKKIITVVKLDRESDAKPLGEALCKGGLPVAEVTFRTGAAEVKFFPAVQCGGLGTIKALAAPFPSLKFMPTGGINASNVLEFLAFDKIIACGGSWMVKDSLINEGNFEEIARLTAEAVTLVSR